MLTTSCETALVPAEQEGKGTGDDYQLHRLLAVKASLKKLVKYPFLP